MKWFILETAPGARKPRRAGYASKMTSAPTVAPSIFVPESNPSAPTILGMEQSLAMAIGIASSIVCAMLCLGFIGVTIAVALLVAKKARKKEAIFIGVTVTHSVDAQPQQSAASANPLRSASLADVVSEPAAGVGQDVLDEGGSRNSGKLEEETRHGAVGGAATGVQRRRRRSSTVIGPAPSDSQLNALLAVDEPGTNRRASTMKLSRPRCRTDSISVKVVVDDDGVTTLYAHPVDQDEIDAWFDTLEEKPKEARRVPGEFILLPV